MAKKIKRISAPHKPARRAAAVKPLDIAATSELRGAP
jgi:hypothetical protein